jgi:hypothetical protein
MSHGAENVERYARDTAEQTLTSRIYTQHAQEKLQEHDRNGSEDEQRIRGESTRLDVPSLSLRLTLVRQSHQMTTQIAQR